MAQIKASFFGYIKMEPMQIPGLLAKCPILNKRLFNNFVFVNQISETEIQLTPIEIVIIDYNNIKDTRQLCTNELGAVLSISNINEERQTWEIFAHPTIIIEDNEDNISKIVDLFIEIEKSNLKISYIKDFDPQFNFKLNPKNVINLYQIFDVILRISQQLNIPDELTKNPIYNLIESLLTSNFDFLPETNTCEKVTQAVLLAFNNIATLYSNPLENLEAPDFTKKLGKTIYTLAETAELCIAEARAHFDKIRNH